MEIFLGELLAFAILALLSGLFVERRSRHAFAGQMRKRIAFRAGAFGLGVLLILVVFAWVLGSTNSGDAGRTFLLLNSAQSFGLIAGNAAFSARAYRRGLPLNYSWTVLAVLALESLLAAGAMFFGLRGFGG